MLKTGKRIRHHRRYSEEFKRKLVTEFEKGLMSVVQLEREYGVSDSLIYKWIYTYSTYNEKNIHIVELKDSQTHRVKELEAQVKELHQILGQKQLKIDFLEKMIDLAKDDYGIDIKKNFSIPPSGGSKSTKKR